MLYNIVKKSVLQNKGIKNSGNYIGVPMPFKRLSEYIPLSCERGQSIGVLGATGCLAADTLIKVSRASKHSGKYYTIEKLYSMQNSFRKGTLGPKENRVQVFKYDIDSTGYHKIIKVVKSGIKKVYKVTTESGLCIKSTFEHKYLISTNKQLEDDNFKELKELSVGDSVYVKSPKVVNGRKKIKKGKEVFEKMPYYTTCSTKYINGKYSYQRVSEYRMIYDAKINNLTVEEFLNEVKNNPNHTLVFSDRNMDIHHIDGNHFNNNPENLTLLTKYEHNKLHADYTRLGFHKIHKEKIVSIEYVGEEMTYDIMCEDPYHNFIANGFVVHNSGKSRFARFMYIYNVYKFHKETGYPIRIIYFPLEDSKEKVMRNMICHYIHELYGIYVSLQELDSKGNRELPDFVVDKLNEAEEFFREFESIVTVVDGYNQPTEIFNFCQNYALRTGTIQTYEVEINGKIEKQKRYIANNDVHTIIVVDNMSNIDIEEGRKDEREAIVYFCKNLVRGRLCNFFNFTVVQVLQQDFASERQSFTRDGETMIAKLEPSLAGVGDSKTITRSMHMVLGIFHPARFGIQAYPIKTKFQPLSYRLDILGNKFRSLHILKANDVEIEILFDKLYRY